MNRATAGWKKYFLNGSHGPMYYYRILDSFCSAEIHPQPGGAFTGKLLQRGAETRTVLITLDRPSFTRCHNALLNEARKRAPQLRGAAMELVS